MLYLNLLWLVIIDRIIIFVYFQKMLKHIYCEGAIVEGIFRKSPKQSTVKLVKCQLDDGRSVDFEHEHNPLVTASVLKVWFTVENVSTIVY
jgi:hypothetical protein